MENQDWSKFSVRISIDAEKEVILSHFSTQEHLEKWFLESAVFYQNGKDIRDRNSTIEVGDTYRWMWHASDDVGEGEVLKVNADIITFTFLGCVVSVSVSEEGGENLLELIQSEISQDEASKMSYYTGCTRGWTFYLTNLKSILEGGLDLRNKNHLLQDVINT